MAISKNVRTARKRWEKRQKKIMTDDEFTMFNWGYSYAVVDMIKQK